MKIRSYIRQYTKFIFRLTILSLLYSSLAAFVYVNGVISKGNNGVLDQNQAYIIHPLIISILTIIIVTIIIKCAILFNIRKKEKIENKSLNKKFIPIVFISFVLSLIAGDIGVEMIFSLSGIFFPDLILSHKDYMAGLYISLASAVASLVVVLGSAEFLSSENSAS